MGQEERERDGEKGGGRGREEMGRRERRTEGEGRGWRGRERDGEEGRGGGVTDSRGRLVPDGPSHSAAQLGGRERWRGEW